ncbi:MAG: hypothetical protein IKH19_09565 [Muribaculaceae bacterium]|nr:hypothetical protein [Muribaculaceae bacterium]
MERTIVITPTVINRLKNMSVEEKRLMLDTLLSDEVLCVDRCQPLSPVQELIYMMFHDTVVRESCRLAPLAACSLVS